MWKIGKCLTHRFTLPRMKTFTCAIIFYPLSHRHSWQATPEPFTGIGQCGLSWFSRLSKASLGCNASSLTLGAYVARAFFGEYFLVKMDCSVYIFLFQYFHFFYFTFCSGTLVVGVDPSFFLMPRCWTAETRWLRPQKFVGSIFSKKTRRQNL